MIPTIVQVLWLEMMFHLAMLSSVNPPPPPKDGDEYGRKAPAGRVYKLGPSLSVGVPRLIQPGVDAKFFDRFGLGASYGLIPQFSFKSTEVKLHAFEVHVAWFPYRQAFHLGGVLGRQTLTGIRTQDVDGLPVTGQLDINTLYFSPEVGWRWERPSGFFWGLDLGWQIPISVTSVFTSSVTDPAVIQSSEYQDLQSTVTEAGDNLGREKLPTFRLSVGWMF